MLRPGGVAGPAPARTFTTELSWTGSPQKPRSAITGWLIVIYHRRTFTGWTGSLMGCEPTHAENARRRENYSAGPREPKCAYRAYSSKAKFRRSTFTPGSPR